jgi:acyl-CoA reductase-like NAD-dependent aldehyde dehydrogenase
MPASGNRGAASGAGNLKPPVRIYDDADLNAAIPMAAMGIFVHSGHGCVCRSRIFVRRGGYDQVLERIAAVAIMLQPNGPKKDGSHIGALISQKQLSVRRRQRMASRCSRVGAGLNGGILRCANSAHQYRSRHQAVSAGDLRSRW